ESGIHKHRLEGFGRGGLATNDPPVVAVNAHAGDPHFETSATKDTAIRPGDWLLVDLWAREDRPGTVYADSTWVAFVGADVPARNLQVFDVVVAARDAAVERIRDGFARGEPVEGWQVDRVARDLITTAR